MCELVTRVEDKEAVILKESKERNGLDRSGVVNPTVKKGGRMMGDGGEDMIEMGMDEVLSLKHGYAAIQLAICLIDHSTLQVSLFFFK